MPTPEATPDGGPARSSLRFVFMADCQFGAYASFSGLDDDDVAAYAARGLQVEAVPSVEGFAWDAARYRLAVDAANELSPAFVVMGGDMLDDPDDDAARRELVRLTERLSAPMHWVPGNHDVAVPDRDPSPASLVAYREHWGPDHYDLVHGDTTVIVVNSSVWIHAEQLPEAHAHHQDLLEQRLARARDRGGPVVVCGHHPLFTRDPDEPDSYWNVPRAQRSGLVDLFVAHGVTTYLCGHWHRNGGGTVDGLEVVVTGPVGYPLGDDPSGFRVVDVRGGAVHHDYVSFTGDVGVGDGQTGDHRGR
ncbi:metallophosphoesterase [Salsipaludibacter albus]|uniref:metallophosphoesterase n=1 Tax=Salsipaludibacter albus TaxID=2849650 RepID=UPI001EE3A82E|nr:metallophosphoesterase [Salsipaludibacter albus]MBY5163320.1 metallophosphoesterase [Salsipaludibacter albus]